VRIGTDSGILAASFPHWAITVIEQNLSLVLVVTDEHAVGKLVGRFMEVWIMLAVVFDRFGVLLFSAQRQGWRMGKSFFGSKLMVMIGARLEKQFRKCSNSREQCSTCAETAQHQRPWR
jgi:hypothetical protein